MECSICFGILGDNASNISETSDKSLKETSQKKTNEEIRNSDQGHGSQSGGDRAPRSGKSRIVTQLLKQSTNKESSLSCTICGHIFHRTCIKSWLKKSDRRSGYRPCPICRRPISNISELRTVYLNFRTENCSGCAQWKKDYKKLEQHCREQGVALTGQLENARKEASKAHEVSEKLKKRCIELESLLDSEREERERVILKVENMQQRYEILLKDLQSLKLPSHENCKLIRGKHPCEIDVECTFKHEDHFILVEDLTCITNTGLSVLDHNPNLHHCQLGVSEDPGPAFADKYYHDTNENSVSDDSVYSQSQPFSRKLKRRTFLSTLPKVVRLLLFCDIPSYQESRDEDESLD